MADHQVVKDTLSDLAYVAPLGGNLLHNHGLFFRIQHSDLAR